MDFRGVLERVAGHLDETGADWAVIGGLALAAHGAGRLTHDLDIVTERSARAGLVAHLEAEGYETLHVSDGYSNHAHPDAAGGRVDVVYVGDPTARQLFAEARELELLPGLSARVPLPEHLVAMKVLAAHNDPSRRLQELADIVALLRATETSAGSVRRYFERYDMLAEWREVRDGL